MADDVMQDAAGGVYAAAVLLDASALGVLVQPTLELELVPTLAQTQALASSHARRWLDVTASALIQPLQDVRDYGAGMESFGPELLDSARGAADGDPAALGTFLTGVQYLEGLVGSERQSVGASTTTLGAFRQLTDDDAVRFATDARTLAERYTGPSGDIARIDAQLAALSARMDSDNATTAQGASQAIPGAIIVGIGFGVAYVDTDLGKTIIKQGITMAEGAVKASDDAMKDFHAAAGEYQQALTALASEQQEVGVFATLRDNVGGVGTGVLRATTALAELDRAWQDELVSLQVLGATAKGTSRGQVPDMVTTAVARWETLTKGATALLDALEDEKSAALGTAAVA